MVSKQPEVVREFDEDEAILRQCMLEELWNEVGSMDKLVYLDTKDLAILHDLLVK